MILLEKNIRLNRIYYFLFFIYENKLLCLRLKYKF